MTIQTIKTNQMTLNRYKCGLCGAGYPMEALALKCEAWCEIHGQPSTDNLAKAVGLYDGRQIRAITVVEAKGKRCCHCNRKFKIHDMAYLVSYSGNVLRCSECEIR